jgi:hypothetical protein
VTFWASAGLAPNAKKTVTAAMRKPSPRVKFWRFPYFPDVD